MPKYSTVEYKLTEYYEQYCKDLRDIRKGLRTVTTEPYRKMYLDLLEDQVQCLNNGNNHYEKVIIEIFEKIEYVKKDYDKHLNELCKLINELLKLVKKNQ